MSRTLVVAGKLQGKRKGAISVGIPQLIKVSDSDQSISNDFRKFMDGRSLYYVYNEPNLIDNSITISWEPIPFEP